MKKDTLFQPHNHGRIQIFSLNAPIKSSYNLTFTDYVDSIKLNTGETDNNPEEQFAPKTKIVKWFERWILDNYKKVLTGKQIQYLDKTDEDRKKEFRRDTISKLRKNIIKRLMLKFFGKNVEFSNRLNYYLEAKMIIERLLSKSYNNKDFSDYIVLMLDTEYMNELVYSRISEESYRQIMYRMTNRNYTPKVTALNEIYEIVEADLETFIKKLNEQEQL